MVTVFIEHTKVIAKVLKKYYGLTPLGLSLSEYRILDAVRTAEEPVRSTDIARRLLLDRSVVSLFKDTMVEKGLVSFTPAEGDRRNYTVTLTPEGEGLALSARRVIESGRPTRTRASCGRVSRGALFGGRAMGVRRVRAGRRAGWWASGGEGGGRRV